jgi:hypothetical protein
MYTPLKGSGLVAELATVASAGTDQGDASPL